jgi:hypothetical protein
MDTRKLKLAMQWREELETGELIECKNYTRSYMGFDSVSQDMLDNICEVANLWWERRGKPLRIFNSMGEIRPGSTDRNY